MQCPPAAGVAILPLMRAVSLIAAGLLLLHAAAVPAAAQQVIRIGGKVIDEGGRPLRGVEVVATNPDQAPARLTTTTNDEGAFGFIGIRRGTWTFSAAPAEYEAYSLRITVTTGLRQPPIELRLVKKPVPAALPFDGVKARDIQDRIDRAEALAARGDLDGAIGAWQELLARAPALTAVYLAIGDLYERKGDQARALDSYRRLLQLDPSNEKAKQKLAQRD
jgi:tetratricopeptide (TPR) repeat protein